MLTGEAGAFIIKLPNSILRTLRGLQAQRMGLEEPERGAIL